MIYLFHGDDAFLSRQRLFDAISKYQQVKRLSKKEVSLENLATFNLSLFSGMEKRALVLENLFSLPVTGLKEIIKLMIKLEPEIDIFIWEEKVVTPGKISGLGKNLKTFSFKLPAKVFYFLDSVGDRTSKMPVVKLEESLKTYPAELILFLLSRRFRDLLLAKVNPESLKGAPWQKSKILSQANKLNLEETKKMYLKLIETEWLNKTGRLGNSLENELFNLVAVSTDG
ncbi:MAG: hypothetical protein ABH867_00420 [Patescibacteria group bacterium]|nr:hypothetical protein [Patescibacteria group bacterium]